MSDICCQTSTGPTVETHPSAPEKTAGQRDAHKAEQVAVLKALALSLAAIFAIVFMLENGVALPDSALHSIRLAAAGQKLH